MTRRSRHPRAATRGTFGTGTPSRGRSAYRPAWGPCSCSCRCSACWSGRRGTASARILADSQVLDALRLSLVCATVATLISVVLGVPLAWVLARARVPGISVLRALVTLPLVLPPVVGGVALLLAFGRQGVLGRLAGRADRRHAAVHHGRRGGRRDLRGHAVPRRHRGGGVPGGRPGVRGGRRHPRRLAADRLPPRHPAAGGALAGGRHRPVLGAGARGVRGDDHVRRQLPGAHADDAAGGLPRPAERSRRSDRPLARAAAGVRRRPGWPARPVAAPGTTL